MEENSLENYCEKVNEQVRKYFDENKIDICFTLEDWALKLDFKEGISIDDSAKSFIKELLED